MLHVGLFADYTSSGTLLFDFSPHATELSFNTDEHGFADCRLFAPLSGFEAFWLYQRALIPHLAITDNGVVIWEGRLEDPRVTNRGDVDSDGISLAALGYYRSLSDIPHTANYTSVNAGTIVAALLADAAQLSSSTALIQSPGVTLSESYDDKKPSEILDRLVRLGDSNTPPRIWEACVWQERMLTFQPRGASGRSWYVDISELEIERTLQTLYNSAYGIYYDASNVRAVSSTATDQASVNRWGITRRQSVNAQTRAAAIAANVRDSIVEDGREPAPRAEINFDAIYDAAGARWPLYYARSGDTITIRNMPPMMSVALNRIRTFTILQTQYNAIADTLKVTPESPLSTLQEQMSGGPSNSPSSRSSPLTRMNDRIGSLEQEIHGGPGGGGGGGSGGGGSYLVPTGGIMMFNGACPTGWSEYTAARGRALVGVPSGGTVEGTVGSALTNLDTRTISTVVAHLHAAGTLANAAETSHTHGAGSFANTAEAAHTHGNGSLAADNESAHTHADGSLVNSDESVHNHTADPPVTTSSGISIDHTHPIDPPNTTSASGGSHNHASSTGDDFLTFLSGAALSLGGVGSNVARVANTDTEAAHTHDVNIASFNSGIENNNHTHTTNISAFATGAGSAHGHTITGNTAAGTAHGHNVSGSSAAGSSHNHTFSGTSAGGSTHNHAISGSVASTGSASVDVTMPYIQLRLCQKD